MRVREVSGYGMWRVAAGRRDPFLHRRQPVQWFGWLVLILSGAACGWIAAQWILESAG